MKTKILVLASSTKHGGRCVAGRRWLGGTADSPQLGEWIRPLGEGDRGAIRGGKYRLYWTVGRSRLEGHPVKPGDLVEIDLEDDASQDFQRENRKMKSDAWINLVKKIPLTDRLLKCVEEEPDGLWLPSRANETKSDRVPVTQLEEHSTPSQSLFCIHPENLRIDPEKRRNDSSKVGYRANFRIKNQNYDLSITDPEINRDLIDQPSLQNCRLVISLGTPFTLERDSVKYHFKLVAAVLYRVESP